MTPATPPTPLVFISYAHENEEHRDWVRHLAENLHQQGVRVLLDQWHLQPGDDIALFMEDAFRQARYVLLICTEKYALKANARAGGVGYEQAVFVGRLLTQGQKAGNQLLPLVRMGTPSTALPTYLQSRLFVDFRDDTGYTDAFNQLLRRLLNAPLHVEPELGPPPAALLPQVPRRQARPQYWILVAGTGQTAPDGPLAVASQQLGRALAQAGFGLVSGGWSGVDELVSTSFADELERLDLPLEDRLTQVLPQGKRPAFGRGHLVLVQPGEEEWTEQIKRANAVVLLGGVGGTRKSGEYGLMFGRPVLPLAATGGDAAALHAWMLREWQPGWLGGLGRDRFEELSRRMPDMLPALIRLLTELTTGGLC